MAGKGRRGCVVLESAVGVRKQGRLEKRGQQRKNWKTRWFVLTESSLRYFDGDGNGSQKGELVFASDMDVTVDVRDPCKWNFSIISDGRTLSLRTNSEEEMQSWVAALNEVMYVTTSGIGSTVNVEGIIRTGWMQLRGAFKKYHRRWFILRAGALYHYKTRIVPPAEGEKVPGEEVVVLLGCQVERGARKDGYAFRLWSTTGDLIGTGTIPSQRVDSCHFMVDTQCDLDDWMLAIRQAEPLQPHSAVVPGPEESEAKSVSTSKWAAVREQISAPLSRERVVMNNVDWDGAARGPCEVARDLLTKMLALFDTYTDITRRHEQEGIGSHITMQVAEDNGEICTDFECNAEALVSMRVSGAFKAVLRATGELACVDMAQLVEPGPRLAFYLNVYNLLLLHSMVAISNNKASRQRLMAKEAAYKLGGLGVVSISELEHGLIRASLSKPSGFVGTRFLCPKYDEAHPRSRHVITQRDPRVNCVLCTGSLGSPRVFVFHEDRLDEQLHAQTRTFVQEHVEVNVGKRKVVLPKVFDLYKKDFVGSNANNEALVEWIKPYLCPCGASLLQRVEATAPPRALPYNVKFWEPRKSAAFYYKDRPSAPTYSSPTLLPIFEQRQQLRVSRHGMEDGEQLHQNLAPCLLEGEEIILRASEIFARYPPSCAAQEPGWTPSVTSTSAGDIFIHGSLVVTTFKMWFQPHAPPVLRSPVSPPWDPAKVVPAEAIALGAVNWVEESSVRTTDTIRREDARCTVPIWSTVSIHTKDGRVLRLGFVRGQSLARRKLIFTIEQAAFTSDEKATFAFTSLETFNNDGWKVYDPAKEMERLGVCPGGAHAGTWRMTSINRHYEVCDTYPDLWAVPANVEDEKYVRSARFRKRGRVQVLSWIHLVSGATITRCSQPLAGIRGDRNKDDEDIMDIISRPDEADHSLIILDARPHLNALANTAMGAGSEAISNYDDGVKDLVFLGIENIHVMRDALRKLRELCACKSTMSPSKWAELVRGCPWLSTHVACVLEAANKTAHVLAEDRNSVLLHCSDGWDRTPQLSSLAMLMMDPYYRTLQGFMVLIEKEWLSFGHKFSIRIGHCVGDHLDEQRSPIFLQFIDCVWQLSQQHAPLFEFNEELLLCIVDGLTSHRFGTFLYNSPKQRAEAGVLERTNSIWSWVLDNEDVLLNANYTPSSQVMYAKLNIKPRLWTRYYLRDLT